MNGLDLFSGIGGLTRALDGYVRPVAYCEIEPYARAVLLSRMAGGELPTAPIWDDVTSLRGSMLPPVDIIYGGFPCQDLSVAGRGAGLEGKRSGLFFEIVRLAEEIKPRFIFLENVPNIRTKGLSRVIGELARLRYDCRWGLISAADVGAPHKRERWFLLGRARLVESSTSRERESGPQKPGELRPMSEGQGSPADHADGSGADVAHSDDPRLQGRDGQVLPERPSERTARTSSPHELAHAHAHDSRLGVSLPGGAPQESGTGASEGQSCVSDAQGVGLEGKSDRRGMQERTGEDGRLSLGPVGCGWWESEPNVGRVAHGVSARVDRLRALGNAVVPAQAREAFERLMGLK